jgi:hypothetical protein
MTGEEFLWLLNSIDFPRRYWELCDRFPIRATGLLERGWKEAIVDAFQEMGVVSRYDARDHSFECEQEQIGRLVWSGLFSKQRYGVELAFSGDSSAGHVGSNLAVLAYDAKRLADPTFQRDKFVGPPPYPRPAYNGDVVILKEIVKEFVRLVRLIKDTIREREGRFGPSVFQ